MKQPLWVWFLLRLNGDQAQADISNDTTKPRETRGTDTKWLQEHFHKFIDQIWTFYLLLFGTKNETKSPPVCPDTV